MVPILGHVVLFCLKPHSIQNSGDTDWCAG